MFAWKILAGRQVEGYKPVCYWKLAEMSDLT